MPQQKAGPANCRKHQGLWLQCADPDRSRWQRCRRDRSPRCLRRARHDPGADAVPRSPEAQLRAFRICDNRLTEIATWDDQLLAEQLKDLSLLGLDFSLEVTGFDMAEIDLRIDSLEGQPQGDDPADRLPGVAAGPPVSKLGDLWRLGRHRLLCGSALDTNGLQGADGRGTRLSRLHRPAL